jgi:hypothetical protein
MARRPVALPFNSGEGVAREPEIDEAHTGAEYSESHHESAHVGCRP